MQQQSPTRAPQAPVILDPQGHVSRHVARKVRTLIGRTAVWSIDGMDIRQRRAYLAAGVRLPAPTLVRGTSGGHRVQIETNMWGQAEGRCDCRAARFGMVCSHLLALACHAVTLGWTSA